MTRIHFALVLAGIAVSALVFHAQAQAPQAAYKFTEIVPGIYSAIGTGTMNVGSNSAVIVNKDDVMTVHKAHYATIQGPGISVSTVSRMFEVMEGRADR